MDFIETPRTQNNIIPAQGGKRRQKMSQKQSTPEAKAPKAKYSKTRGEHIKDVIIAVLITGIIAFVGGVSYQTSQQKAIEAAVQGAQVTASTETKK